MNLETNKTDLETARLFLAKNLSEAYLCYCKPMCKTMELFGILTKVGDTRMLPPRKPEEAGLEIREIFVEDYVMHSGLDGNYAGKRLRVFSLLGERARNFPLEAGCFICLEYSEEDYEYTGKDNILRIGNRKRVINYARVTL